MSGVRARLREEAVPGGVARRLQRVRGRQLQVHARDAAPGVRALGVLHGMHTLGILRSPERVGARAVLATLRGAR